MRLPNSGFHILTRAIPTDGWTYGGTNRQINGWTKILKDLLNRNKKLTNQATLSWLRICFSLDTNNDRAKGGKRNFFKSKL